MSGSSSANPRQTPERGLFEGRVDSSTTTSAPLKAQLVNIPAHVFQEACDFLEDYIHPQYDDSRIRRNLKHIWFTVQDALQHDPKFKERLADQSEFLDNVKRKEQTFIDSLRAMGESGNWAALLEDDIFLRPHVQKAPDPAAIKATERAWDQKYKGEAVHVLLKTISSFLDKGRNPYSRQTNIMNSSGTGKSRMVDELSRKIITVPMCLRPDENQGFPPADFTLRSWVLSGDTGNQSAVQNKMHGFMYGLLTVTRTTLENIERKLTGIETGWSESETKVIKRQEYLAAAFRECMTDGQTFKASNDYREGFYKKVIEVANKEREGLDGAGKKLLEFMDPNNKLDRKKGSPRRPLVIFAFDEAHILTDNPAKMPWNLFSELRRILQQISDLAIFSLFLSTAGRFHLFSPETRSDPSSRVREATSHTLNPITEISFDDIAHLARRNTVTLSDVVKIDWMCRLGRPLFGSRWDAMNPKNEKTLLNFAKGKLLDGSTELPDKDPSGPLACLSVRFALDFDLGERRADEVICTQVERHMRLCLAATAGRERFITLAGSEPLLAEAAREIMRFTTSNPVQHLANHADLNCIDRGRRGELVAMLLIMRAFDAARGGDRWVTVDNFMKHLLPEDEYKHLRGSFLISSLGEKKNFVETFKDYGMWFNHVIKIEQKALFSAEHLWKFITRGAMVLCANGQEGIDIVLPVCNTEKTLSPDTVTAALIQVKNNGDYGLEIDKTVLDRMDPISLGLFPDGVTPKPVIRAVFALASREAGVKFPKPPERERHHDDKFTAFDVWIAGLSAFNNINGDLGSYQILLDRSLQPHDAFDLKDEKELDQETRDSRGGIRRRMAPLTMTDDSHHCIY